jgi:hypothetical protein
MAVAIRVVVIRRPAGLSGGVGTGSETGFVLGSSWMTITTTAAVA